MTAFSPQTLFSSCLFTCLVIFLLKAKHIVPLQYSCLENPHGQRNLKVYSPWGCKESDTTEHNVSGNRNWLNRPSVGEFVNLTRSGAVLNVCCGYRWQRFQCPIEPSFLSFFSSFSWLLLESECCSSSVCDALLLYWSLVDGVKTRGGEEFCKLMFRSVSQLPRTSVIITSASPLTELLPYTSHSTSQRHCSQGIFLILSSADYVFSHCG